MPGRSSRRTWRGALAGLLWLLARAAAGDEVQGPAPPTSAAPARPAPADAGPPRPAPAPPPIRPSPAARPPVGPPAPPSLSLAPAAPAPSPSPSPTPSLTDLASFAGGGIPLMLGDLAPGFGPSALRAGTAPSAIRFPSARGYKMADNQSPRPQDRVFVAFNFFDDLNQPPGTGLHQVKVYREFFGVEKTFFDGRASVGLRLPLNTITALGDTPGRGGSSTALGDLTVFVKGILWQAPANGSLISAGLAVTPPNGPSSFAGAPFAKTIPATSLQPFLAGIGNFGRWYVQGFTGSNIPTDGRVTTMYYNDIGAGYYLYRADDPRALVSAIVPTMEVHVNTPLNNRATTAVGAPPGTPDIVDLTFGVSTVLRRRAVLSAGIVDPVTGPRPDELEAVVLLNVFFGRTRTPPTPPPTF